MLFYAGLILLTIAVSLDSFGVGVTYGMRRIRVPFLALLIIVLCSGMMVLLSMTLGALLGSMITPTFAEILGGLILIGIGLFSLINIMRSKKELANTPNIIEQKPVITKSVQQKVWILEIKKLGILITVLKKPQDADLDHSGTISAKEAFLLGFALALDAFGAGIGAAMIGYSPLLTALLVSIMSGLFVTLGIKSGYFLSKRKWMQKMAFLPPCLLIMLGLFNIVM